MLLYRMSSPWRLACILCLAGCFISNIVGCFISSTQRSFAKSEDVPLDCLHGLSLPLGKNVLIHNYEDRDSSLVSIRMETAEGDFENFVQMRAKLAMEQKEKELASVNFKECYIFNNLSSTVDDSLCLRFEKGTGYDTGIRIEQWKYAKKSGILLGQLEEVRN